MWLWRFKSRIWRPIAWHCDAKLGTEVMTHACIGRTCSAMRVLQNHFSTAFVEKAGWQQIHVKFFETRKYTTWCQACRDQNKTWRGTLAKPAANNTKYMPVSDTRADFLEIRAELQIKILSSSISAWLSLKLRGPMQNEESLASKQLSTACLWLCNHTPQGWQEWTTWFGQVWTWAKSNLWEASEFLRFWWTWMNIGQLCFDFSLHSLYFADTSWRDLKPSPPQWGFLELVPSGLI